MARIILSDPFIDPKDEGIYHGILDMSRNIVKGSIEYQQVYGDDDDDDDDEMPAYRIRQGLLQTYLDRIDHHEAHREDGHVSFMPHLNAVWGDSEFSGGHDHDVDRLYTYPTIEKAREVARVRSEHIIRDWQLLSNIVQRHESTIQKRWVQKTNEKRKEILLRAWPGMPSRHRPDFQEFWSRETAEQSNRDAYVWPYINIQDLTKPRIFRCS